MIESIITRKIDKLGRLVIPKEIRKNFNIKADDKIEFFFDGDFICLRKKKPSEPSCCDSCPYRKGND